MAVAIHYVNIGLFWVDATGAVILKDVNGASADDIRRAVAQEHRVIPNLSGSGSTANSADYPKIADYLDSEASDDFAFAYMDQTQLVTQMIT